MNRDLFVKQIKKLVVEESTNEYRDILDKTNIDETKDEYWYQALLLYNALSSEQKETLINIIREVSLDTTSHIFGIVDGSSYFDGSGISFNLIDSDGDNLDGYLQSTLLEDE